MCMVAMVQKLCKVNIEWTEDPCPSVHLIYMEGSRYVHNCSCKSRVDNILAEVRPGQLNLHYPVSAQKNMTE